MADTSRRVPLWAIALVGGMGVFTILGIIYFWFIFWIRFVFLKEKKKVLE